MSGWLLYAAVNTAFGLAFQSFAWSIIGIALLLSGLGLLASHLYRQTLQRYAWLNLSLLRLIVLIATSSVGLAVLVTATMTLFNLALLPAFTLETFQWRIAFVMVFNLSVTFLAWITIYVGLHYFWNHRRLEIEKWRLEATLKASELDALKAQLNPHFLFNSLNSVRGLIAEDPTRAQDAVTLLARLLRSSLQSNTAPTIPLRAELQTVKDYLALEGIRLEERLRYRLTVDEALHDVPVPPMLIQTLVENALKHGIATLPNGGDVSISVEQSDDQLHIDVTNSGQLQHASSSTQVGLANARERLDLLFGTSATLTLKNSSPETVTAHVTLPLSNTTVPVLV